MCQLFDQSSYFYQELIEKRRAVYDEFMTYRRKKEKDLEVLKLQYSELRTGKYLF